MIKSVRLTNIMRDDILNSIQNAFKENKPSPDLGKASLDMGVFTYERAFKDVLEYLHNPKLKKFFRCSKNVYCIVNNTMHSFDLPESWPIFYQNSNQAMFMYDKEPKLYKEYKKVEKEYEGWNKEFANLYKESKQLVYSCNTTKQLIEIWPNVEDLLPAYIANPSKGVNLPAIPVSRLNEKLGFK